ncbi:MAG: histidine kinase, partial [Verrucomicrobiota bacterium]|nr:histidine kinase [Verrucomicrobiota bacterium]
MLTQLFAILLMGILPISTIAEQLKEIPLSELEQRLAEIDRELEQLARYSLRSGVGAIGYRSEPHDDENHPEWIQIDLREAAPVDEVVLVPILWRDTNKGFQADAFPDRFRVLAGTADHPKGIVVAEYDSANSTHPGIAPLVVPIPETTASWIRIEATHLSSREFDEKYIFQLSEILIFSGSENLALHRPVKVSSDSDFCAWNARFVVDGFMPYLMDAAQGKQSVAYLSPDSIGDNSFLEIDLSRSVPLSRIHLHAMDQSDTVPQAFAGDFGMPNRMLVEGANKPDFSDAKVLLDIHHKTIYDTGPIMMWNFPETVCRYVRLTIVKFFVHANRSKFGFAEIELFSKGRNMAKNKPFRSSFPESDDPSRFLAALTDGNNLYGGILPVREWLNQLALRHTLEIKRPLVTKELQLRYTRQKANLTRMGWLVALLMAGTVIMVLVNRIVRQRAIYRTREQIAADLHDELGANLHALGLLSDLARAAKASPEKLEKLLQRIRALTERTGAAARYCGNLLEAKGLYENLVEDMRKTSGRL